MVKKLSPARVFSLGSALVGFAALGFYLLPGMLDKTAPGSAEVNAFYCAVITLTTVGFGDVCPSGELSALGKTFLVGMSFLGLGFFTGVLMDFAASWKDQVPGGIFALASLTLAVGVAIFTSVEDMTTMEAAYFSVIIGTTIGFGDISPKSDLGKLAVALYAIAVVNVIGALLEPARTFLEKICISRETTIPQARTSAATKETKAD